MGLDRDLHLALDVYAVLANWSCELRCVGRGELVLNNQDGT